MFFDASYLPYSCLTFALHTPHICSLMPHICHIAALHLPFIRLHKADIRLIYMRRMQGKCKAAIRHALYQPSVCTPVTQASPGRAVATSYFTHARTHTHAHAHAHTHTQGVQWLLLRNPLYIYGSDYQALHALMHNNFRPVQPLYGRTVTTTVP